MHDREGHSGGQDPGDQGQLEPGTPVPGSAKPVRREPAGVRPERTAQGGSYGGGGGYRRGGFEQGNFDPALETPSRRAGRDEGSRGGWGRGRDYGDYADPRGDTGWPEGAGGDWRTGYGGYGMSGQERQNTDEESQDWNGYDRPAGDYGLGGGGRAVGHGGPAGQGGSGTTRDESVPARPWRERGPSGRGPDRQLPLRPHREPHWPYLEPWAVPGPHTGLGPEDYERSEEAIRNDVCERLTLHGRLDASRIRVSVERGEIILEGEVDSRSAKRTAEDTAETVAGVHDVHNRLRISQRAR